MKRLLLVAILAIVGASGFVHAQGPIPTCDPCPWVL